MPGIVCAIRGGPASEPTIQKAFETAKTSGLPVYFLYVVDITFLSRSSHVDLPTVSKEIYQMGEFILLAVQARAESQGVEAHAVVRDGQLSEELIGLCREVRANYVILGAPRGQPEDDAFTHPELDEFAAHIRGETGAEIIVARGN